MREADFGKIVNEYSDLIESVESFSFSEEEKVSQLKAKLRLFDGTILWIREVRIKGNLEAYSYYWLNSDEKLIIGWDNAPHHKDIASFPHHRHVGSRIESSQERNFKDALNFIKSLNR